MPIRLSSAVTTFDSVLVVDFPDALLHEALHHRVEAHAALLRLRHAEHRLGRGADLHLLLGVALRDLLGRLGVDDLVAHADQPDAGRFARVHRADRRAADRARARTAERAGECAQQAGHLAERAAVEALLRLRDLLGLQDVELHDVLRRLELAHAEELARRLRIAEVVGERELIEQPAQIRALQHLEVRRRELELAEVGDVVRRELLQERCVVALDVARQHDERRALLVDVRVRDRLIGGLVGRGVGLLRRFLARRRRGVAERRLRRLRPPPIPRARRRRRTARACMHVENSSSVSCRLPDPSGASSLLLRRGPRRRRRCRVATIVAVELRDDLVGFFVHERQRHSRHVHARIRCVARIHVRHHAPTARGQRERHVHHHLIDRHQRIHARLHRDQPAEDEARAEAARRGEHRVGVVLEIRVDLRLLDLRADFLGRVRSQAERLQPLVDRLVMRAVVLLLRSDEAVALRPDR